MNKEYRLAYLPLFEEDLAAARDYIAYTLNNPAAALNLVDQAERAILERLKNPCTFAPHTSAKERRYPYYRINVKNFAVFYVVIGDVMEVRRFIYAKRDLTKLL